MTEQELLSAFKEFAKWARKAGKYDLARCSSGNLSHRLDDGTMMVSASRSWLSNLKKDQVVQVSCNDGKVLKGNAPTGELPLHLAVMNRNPGINTILHCQSPAATSIACKIPQDIDYNVIIEVPIYIGNIKHVPYIKPGSQELADAVAEASVNAGVIQMQNHGQVITGNSYKEVIQKAVFFELACNIMLKNNFQYSTIKADHIEHLKGYR